MKKKAGSVVCDKVPKPSVSKHSDDQETFVGQQTRTVWTRPTEDGRVKRHTATWDKPLSQFA